jgi:hypothetical protein
VKHGRPLTGARQAQPEVALAGLAHGTPCRCHPAPRCAGHLWAELVDDFGVPWHVDPVCTSGSASKP